MNSSLSFSTVIDSLPPEWSQELLPSIQREVKASNTSVVVLDDDPTGTQTVYDVPTLTGWSKSILANELKKETLLFYVLTNSRSLKEEDAKNLSFEIGQNLKEASADTGRDICVISRSDSTLRGHFPAEVDSLARALGMTDAVQVLIPAFFPGGRYTIGDVHYVKDEDRLIPAAETPFARDSAFGYHSSNLRDWVEEKTKGTIKADTVKSISLDDIREQGPQFVADQLIGCQECEVCIVNAASPRDLEVVASALIQAEASGKEFIYRTAASIVPARIGLAPRPLLTREKLQLPDKGGGLIVVGSYVPKSTAQLKFLLEYSEIEHAEISVPRLLSDSRTKEIKRVAAKINSALRDNRDIVIYTSREVKTDSDAEKSLEIINQVSSGVVDIVFALEETPRYMLTKGGITSSAIATDAFRVERANVLGQILPGVPVWTLGQETPHPDMAYIIFPGNVGGNDAVWKVYDQLK